MIRSNVTITTQLGIEVTPGTSVAANRIIRALSFMPRLRRDRKPFRPRGKKFSTLVTTGKEWGEGGYDGKGCYNALIYLLSGLCPAVTPVQIGATAARKWTFQPNSSQEDSTRKTYTFEVGSSVAVDQFAFGQLASMNLNLTQDDVDVTGNLFTRKPVASQTQTASPTEVVARPIQRGQIDVFLDTVYGSIGTTKVTESARESIALGDKYKPFWAHNTSSPSFRDVVEVAPPCTFSFLTPYNSQARAYIASSMDADALHYMRIQAIGDQIASDAGTPVYESLKWDIAGKFVEPDETEEQDAFSKEFHFEAVDDPTNLGSAFKVEIINLLTAL